MGEPEQDPSTRSTRDRVLKEREVRVAEYAEVLDRPSTRGRVLKEVVARDLAAAPELHRPSTRHRVLKDHRRTRSRGCINETLVLQELPETPLYLEPRQGLN